MNKKNRRKMAELKTRLEESSFTEDRYGNILNGDKTIRYKFNETSFRKEVKVDKSWHRVNGGYYKDVTVKPKTVER